MKITEELIKTLKELKEYCNSEQFDINKLTLMLKEYERDYNMKSNELLELLYNKDILFRKVLGKTETIDKEIEKLKKQILVLENEKYQCGSLICELHSHNLEMTNEHDSTGGYWFCTNCGELMRLEGYEVNDYLRVEKQSKSKIYKYEKNN